MSDNYKCFGGARIPSQMSRTLRSTPRPWQGFSSPMPLTPRPCCTCHNLMQEPTQELRNFPAVRSVHKARFFSLSQDFRESNVRITLSQHTNWLACSAFSLPLSNLPKCPLSTCFSLAFSFSAIHLHSSTDDGKP